MTSFDKINFKKLFGVSLSDYTSPSGIFDHIKFEREILKTPKGLAMTVHIAKKYGDEALALFMKLYYPKG